MINLPINEASINYNRGTHYLEKKKYKKAIQFLKLAERVYPCMEVYNNLGVACRALDNDALMIDYYKKALSNNMPSLTGNPDKVLVQILNNLGLAYYMYGNDEEALNCYRKAIRIDPKAWDCWWNSSTTWLRIASSSGSTEDFAKGWEMYRARFLKSDPIKMKNTRADLLYWDTVSDGDEILVLAEQGIGDNLMFARYLKRLKNKFNTIYIQCDESLASLFSAAGYIPIQDTSACSAPVAYPMCSLGECFTDVTQDYNWLEGLFGKYSFDTTKNVGIIFSGNPTHANNAFRSTNIERFNSLSKYANIYCLQPGIKGNKYIQGLNPTSWQTTCEYINGLDLVISVDTSGIHLCGALGRPGWMLQPYKETDFRWGTVNSGSDYGSSVWYPNITVYNNPQSWEFVFNNVERDLAQYFSS